LSSLPIKVRVYEKSTSSKCKIHLLTSFQVGEQRGGRNDLPRPHLFYGAHVACAFSVFHRFSGSPSPLLSPLSPPPTKQLARATTSQNPSDSAGARFDPPPPPRPGFCRSGACRLANSRFPASRLRIYFGLESRARLLARRLLVCPLLISDRFRKLLLLAVLFWRSWTSRNLFVDFVICIFQSGDAAGFFGLRQKGSIYYYFQNRILVDLRIWFRAPRLWHATFCPFYASTLFSLGDSVIEYLTVFPPRR
jgi:hypothetical protein